MTAITTRALVRSKQILSWLAVTVFGYLLVVGALTTGILAYHYEQAFIILGDLAEIQRAEREAPETMRAMKR